jgi:hypothetical protein
MRLRHWIGWLLFGLLALHAGWTEYRLSDYAEVRAAAICAHNNILVLERQGTLPRTHGQ